MSIMNKIFGDGGQDNAGHVNQLAPNFADDRSSSEVVPSDHKAGFVQRPAPFKPQGANNRPRVVFTNG